MLSRFAQQASRAVYHVSAASFASVRAFMPNCKLTVRIVANNRNLGHNRARVCLQVARFLSLQYPPTNDLFTHPSPFRPRRWRKLFARRSRGCQQLQIRLSVSATLLFPWQKAIKKSFTRTKPITSFTTLCSASRRCGCLFRAATYGTLTACLGTRERWILM